MKMLVGDKVVVLKDAEGVDGKVIVAEGVLSKVDTGRKTDDRRAKAEEGPCPADMECAATGWVVVDCAGTPQSFASKFVKMDTVAVRKQSAVTESLLALLHIEKTDHANKVAKARAFCATKGLDADTLSDKNALRIEALLS